MNNITLAVHIILIACLVALAALNVIIFLYNIYCLRTFRKRFIDMIPDHGSTAAENGFLIAFLLCIIGEELVIDFIMYFINREE